MADFNLAFLNINNLSAYDDGATASALPATNLVAGRYFRQTNTDSSYTLYRRAATSWEYVGGPVAPVQQRIAALNGQAATALALTTEPTLGTAGLSITFGGDLTTAGLVRSASYLASAPAGDTLSVATTGRAYVKTQAAGDLGLVLRAHASTAGYLLDVREQGGSDVLTVDAMGRLQTRVPSAFGGASIPAASVLAVSPTTNSSDGITNGLLLYGQPSMPTRSMLAAYSTASDAAPIANWLGNGMTFGKLPWGNTNSSDGQINFAADSAYFRIGGLNNSTVWFAINKALASAPGDPTQDIPVWSNSPFGTGIYQPIFQSQEYAYSTPTVTNLTLYRFNDASASGRFFEFYQATRVNPTTLTFKFVADMNGDGRMRSALMWRGASYPSRDIRQSIKHLATKTWASPGNGPDAGQEVTGAGGSYTYNGFPTMTTRSFGGADLDITVTTELMLDNSAFSAPDGQVYGLECFISINGGAYTSLLKQENAQLVSAPGVRQGGDLMVCRYRALGLGNGATFKIRLVMSTGEPNPNVFLRKYDLIVEETSFEQYVAA